MLGNSHQIRSPQQFADLLPDATSHYPTDPPHLPLEENAGKGTYGEGRLAVLALEAGAVEDDAVGGELVHRVHRLGAHLALLLRPAKHLLPITGQPFLSLSLTSRGRRDLRARSGPWTARAWGMKKINEHLAPASRLPRLYTQENRDAFKRRNYDGFVSPSSLGRLSPSFGRGGKEKEKAAATNQATTRGWLG